MRKPSWEIIFWHRLVSALFTAILGKLQVLTDQSYDTMEISTSPYVLMSQTIGIDGKMAEILTKLIFMRHRGTQSWLAMLGKKRNSSRFSACFSVEIHVKTIREKPIRTSREMSS